MRANHILSAVLAASNLSKRQYLACAMYGVSLDRINGQEFEAVLESVLVAHDSAQFHRLGRQRHMEFKGDHFTGLQFSGQGAPNALLPQHVGATPDGGANALAEGMHEHANVQLMAREPSPGAGRSLWCRSACHVRGTISESVPV